MDIITCSYCEYDNSSENNYCIRCGKPLRNTCTYRNCPNYNDNTLLPTDAAFCPHCGNETIFKINGITSAAFDIDDEDIPF